jgi:hypothetical protein
MSTALEKLRSSSFTIEFPVTRQLPHRKTARFASQERPVRPFSSARLYELVPIGKALTRRLCYLTALSNLTNNMA